MQELFYQAVFIALVGPLLVGLWRAAKTVLSARDAFEESGDSERELRLAQSRARRLRTLRYQEEHASWDKDFRALGGTCNCHALRHAARESI